MKFKHAIEIFFPNAFNKTDIHQSSLDIDFNREIDATQLLEAPQDFLEILNWPPNTFLILLFIVDYTDKYRRIVSPIENDSWGESYITQANELSKSWLNNLKEYLDYATENNFNGKANTVSGVKVCSHLQSELKLVFSEKNIESCIYELLENKNFINNVFKIISAVDMMFDSYYHLAPASTDIITKIVNFKSSRRKIVDPDTFILSFSDNETKTGFVTLKARTPQNGLTINNLTQNLAYIKPAVKPQVITSAADPFHEKSYNILVLPWPLTIKSSFFKKSEKSKVETSNEFGFFDYRPHDEIDLKLYLKALIAALERIGSIDLIVFPECSMSEQEYIKVKDLTYECFQKKTPNILSGIYKNSEDESINEAYLSFIDDNMEHVFVKQSKHHRWYLDEPQIINYNLAGILDVNVKYWENIDVRRRKLLTLHTPNNVHLCPLICEDLARQEPVAQAVRAIGPHLVVALLLDGPQLKFRWPGKYAAVLSDDPGSSVLSVTALGMTERSTGSGNSPSRVVALWGDPSEGSEELEVAKDGIGLVIQTNIVDDDMWSIDGRKNTKKTLVRKFTGTIFDNCDTIKELGLNPSFDEIKSKLKQMIEN